MLSCSLGTKRVGLLILPRPVSSFLRGCIDHHWCRMHRVLDRSATTKIPRGGHIRRLSLRLCIVYKPHLRSLIRRIYKHVAIKMLSNGFSAHQVMIVIALMPEQLSTLSFIVLEWYRVLLS